MDEAGSAGTPPSLHGGVRRSCFSLHTLVPSGSYYLTTTYGALEHIKNYDKITVTRQLSMEVQDSIHRWERRRTLNKARASRSSVQVTPGAAGGGRLCPRCCRPHYPQAQEQDTDWPLWPASSCLPVCAQPCARFQGRGP